MTDDAAKWERLARSLHLWLRREQGRMERSKNHGAEYAEIASSHLQNLRDQVAAVERACQELSH